MSGWLDGIAHEPGRNAGYRAGSNAMRFCALHFTAGACGGDRSVGLNGYFTFYVPRSPSCGPGATQFCEVDARSWHACEWNVYGPGIEFEWIDGFPPALTDYQLLMGGVILRQLRDRYGIPGSFYDGPRVAPGNIVAGFMNHRALLQYACDMHYDGIAFTQFNAMMGGASPLPPSSGSNPGVKGMLCRNKQNGAVYLVGPGHAHHVPTGEEVARLRFVGVPLVEFNNGLEIVAWGRTFGVDGWNDAATWEKTY